LQSARFAQFSGSLRDVSDSVALGVAFTSGEPALIQTALSGHTTIINEDARIRRVSIARPTLSQYLGRSLFFEDGVITSGGDVYCINETVVALLRSGNLSFDIFNSVIVPYRVARFSSEANTMTLEAVLNDVSALFSLRTIGGLLFTALGFSEGSCSFGAMLDDVCRILSQAPPNADKSSLAVTFYNTALADATRLYQDFLRGTPDAVLPPFYPENSAARCYLRDTVADFVMFARMGRTMKGNLSMIPFAPQTRQGPASTPAPPRQTGSAPWAAPAAQPAPAAPTTTSGRPGQNGIGRGSKDCIDDNNGTFTIVSVKYNTAKAIAAFPALLTRCKCVVGSHGRQRERLCPHWDAQTQTGDATHNVVGTGVHEPIAGLSGVKDALDFAKQ
jgi:hypothetical protein